MINKHPPKWSMISGLWRLFGYLPKYRRWQLGAIFLLMLVGAAAEMVVIGAVVPFLVLLTDASALDRYPFVSKIFSMLSWSEGNSRVELASILLAAAAVAAAVVRTALSWANIRFAQDVTADIRCEVYGRILYQPYNYHVVENSGNIIAGLNKTGVISQILYSLMRCAIASIFSISILSVLIRIDAMTAIAAILGISFLYFIITFLTAHRLSANSGIIAKFENLRVQAILEGLGGIRDILLDGSQHVYVSRYSKFDHAQLRARVANGVISEFPRYSVEALAVVIFVFFAFWLGDRSGGINAAIPILGALALGAQKVLPLAQQLFASWASIMGARASFVNVLALLELPISSDYLQTGRPDALRLSDQMTLRNVSFRYHSGGPDVINQVSFDIPRGSRIGITGKTGSGKSTLTDLILGLLQPTGGSITIDDQVLCNHNSRAWQARVAHVPQAIFLCDSSIAENIAFGIEFEKIDLKRVRDAAIRAQLAEFIESQPKKYLTSVGENGIRLSGGQRQRVGLARALYRQADFLVLDEATSALDDATEKSVLDAIRDLGSEVTVLIVAHRITTLGDCDYLIELRAGKVLRISSYDEIQKWQKQTGKQERVDTL